MAELVHDLAGGSPCSHARRFRAIPWTRRINNILAAVPEFAKHSVMSGHADSVVPSRR